MKSDRFAIRERSELTHLGTGPSVGHDFIVYADSQLTRRKRHHIICDGRDTIVFRSRWWSDIIDWLHHEGETQYLVETDKKRYRITAELVRK